MDYIKLENETWLRINIDAIISQKVIDSQETCATWFIKVWYIYADIGFYIMCSIIAGGAL